MAGTRTILWFSCVWRETPGPSPAFSHETSPSICVTSRTLAFGRVTVAVTAWQGGGTRLPHLPQAAGTDVVHGCAAGTPLARQVLAPLTSSSCQGAVWGIPFARAVAGHRQRTANRNRTAKCGGQTRQEFAFSTCREPAGLDTPRQAVSGDWGHRETLPGFFLPIPQAEDPVTWAAPTCGTGDSWQWLLDGWVGLALIFGANQFFPDGLIAQLVLLQLEKTVGTTEAVPEPATLPEAAALTRTVAVPSRTWGRQASPKSHHRPLPFSSQTRVLLSLTDAFSCPFLLTPPSHGVLMTPMSPLPPYPGSAPASEDAPGFRAAP